MFICNFFIEVMGTSRILNEIHDLVHPPNNNNHQKNSDNHSTTSIFYRFIRYLISVIQSRLGIHIRRGDDFVHTPSNNNHCTFSNFYRFIRYLIRVTQSRMGIHVRRRDDLIHVPPASSYLFEKLGVVTYLALVDDELVCCPVSHPHELLLPTDRGMKLLKFYRQDTDVISVSASSDSGNSDVVTLPRSSTATRNISVSSSSFGEKRFNLAHNQLDELEVEFEDRNYWQYLPSLKCIGLCCLLVDSEKDHKYPLNVETRTSMSSTSRGLNHKKQQGDEIPELAEQMLVNYVRQSPPRFQLSSLARCIGFRTDPTLERNRGDITDFTERGRFHVFATRLLARRMTADLHAIGVEESRHWGCLRSDTESVVVNDERKNKYQLLTIGDARTVIDLCSDSWQGKNCTLAPLSQADRQMILDKSKIWALEDLDVCAFSYAPVPFYLDTEKRLVRLSFNTIVV